MPTVSRQHHRPNDESHPAASVAAVGYARTDAPAPDDRSAAAENYYRDLFDNVPIGIYRTTPDGRILTANPALVSMLGYDSFTELAAHNLESEALRTTYPRTRVKEIVEREGEVKGLLSVWKKHDGSTIFLRENSRALRDDEGRIVAYEGTLEDITVQKQAERKWREAEEKYRSIFENAVEGIFQSSVEGRFLQVNPAMARIFGYESPADLIATLTDIERQYYVDPSRRDEFKRLLAENGVVQGFESEAYRKDGTRIWVLENVRGVRDPARAEFLYYEGTVEDITERKLAEQALRASEDCYRAFVVNSTEAISRVEVIPPIPIDLPVEEQLELLFLRGSLAECNDAMAYMYGLSSADVLVGTRLPELLVPTDPHNISYVTRFIRSGYRVLDEESHELDADSRPKYFLNNAVGIVENGCLVRVWGTQRDITARKQSEDEIKRANEELEHRVAARTAELVRANEQLQRELGERQRAELALRESEERYRDLVDNSQGLISTHDLDGRLLSVNPAIAAQLGYAADELIGRNLRELLAPPVRHLFGEYLARCRNEEAHGGVMRVVTRNGEERVWAYHNTRRETPGGGGLAAPYVLGHAHDITERKQAEDEIKRANEELERRVAERTAEMRATNWQLQKELLIRQRAEEALRHSEERYRDLFENANDVHYTHDLRGNFTSVNKAGETIIGYTRDELLEMNVSHLVASDYLELARRMLADKLAGAGTDVYEIEIITKNGRKVMLEFGIRLLLEAGQPVGVQGIARDITERKRVREALRESEERYALAALGANDGLWDWNLKHRHIYFSARWKSMLGYADAEISTRPEEWFDRIHPEDAPKVEREINAHLEGGDGHFESEYRMRHKDGSYRWVLSRGITAVRDAAGRATRMAGSQTDITQRKQAEEQLTHDAFHDVLTGLPNRALFMEHLNLVVEQLARRPASLFAVLFLDLDQFKLINDSLGHVAGDQLLVEISRRLKHCLRPGDTVARLGGDEFTILLHDMKDATDAYYVAERIHDGLTLPLDIDGHEVYTTVSIGIALSSTGFDRPADLLRAADTALYRAKALGRARHEVFDQDMHSRVKTLLQLETDLRRAVERRELRVHYQPIIALDTERVTGFEALVRWQHPERGLVYPASFIPAAEETGLIIPIGRWVLEEACRQARAWQERFRPDPPLSLSVNLSGKQFAQPDLLDTIECILSATGFDAGCLKLEITESVVMENAESTAAMLLRLRAIGVQLNIDDFGTGYSSLSYLQRFPISTLKVDRSFVSRMGGRDEDSKIVRAIIMLAHTLGMDVIAEGVETTAQLAELKSLNCGYAQGNLFSRALSVAEVEELLSLVAATTSAARTIRIDFGQVELT